MATKKKTARTKRAIATPTPAGELPTPKANDSKSGPQRPQIPDGKTPHDPVTFGDLLNLGIIGALPVPAEI